MRQKRITKQILSLVLALFLLCPLIQPLTNGIDVSAAGTIAGKNISIANGIGYFMQDNQLQTYNLETGEQSAVKLGGSALVNAQYVTYDGSNVYIADQDSVIYAYSADDFSSPVWTYDGLKKIQIGSFGQRYQFQVGAEMVVLDGKLYIYTVAKAPYRSYTTILCADTASGTVSVVKEASKSGEYTPRTGNSNMAVIGNTIVFMGCSYASVDTITQTADVATSIYTGGFSYDKKLNALIGGYEDSYPKASGIAMSAYPLVNAGEKEPDVKFSWNAAGNSPVFTSIDGTPVLFSVEQGKVVYEVFTGLDLEKRETGLTAQQLSAVSVYGGNGYLLDQDGKMLKTAVSLDGIVTGLKPTEDAKALDQEIASTIPNSIHLGLEAAVQGMYLRYEAMSAQEKKGVVKAEKLLAAKNTLDNQRSAVDALNHEIDALPTPKELTVAGREAVKAAQGKRDTLTPAANRTLIHTKLDRLLEKTAAYDTVDAIAALPDPGNITIADNVAVQQVLKQEQAVIAQWKGEITNSSRLHEIETALNQLLDNMQMSGEAYWSGMGKNTANAAIVESKTPLYMEQTEILLGGDKSNPISVGDPVFVGDRMYYAFGNKLYCYDLQGNKLLETEMNGSIGFFSRIAYGDGKIFVPLGRQIQAFAAKTLKSLWVSKYTNHQMISTITYHDGYIYSGYTSGGGGGADQTNGAFFCISTKDENPQQVNEEKDYTWLSQTGGYYWAGGVVVGNKIYFAGDAGILYAHHLTEDIVYDSYNVGGQVRANLMYDKQSNRILLGTKDNPHAYSIELKPDGMFHRETIVKTQDGAVGGLTGGLSAYNGRVYSSSGGVHASGGLTVLDAATLQPIYSYANISTQSIPLITTAYATPENGYTVYIYVNDFVSGIGYILQDKQGQTQPVIVDTIQGGTKYNSCSMKADQYGNLYFIGGSASPGYMLTVLKNKQGAMTSVDVTNAIARLPEVETAVYADKPEIEQTYQRYQALSAEEKAELSAAVSAKIQGLKSKIDQLTKELLQKTEEAISKIPETITTEHAPLIETAEKRYVLLIETDRMKLAGRTKLLAALRVLAEQLNTSVPALMQDIDKLPALEEITLEHKAVVMALWNRYQKFSEDAKARVTNIKTLLDAKQKIDDLTDAQTAAELVIKIDTLGVVSTLSLHDEETVGSIYQTYLSLGDYGKSLVENNQHLLEAYTFLTQLRKTVDGISNDIWTRINPLNITLKDKATVEELIRRYEALRPVDQEFVKYYNDVLDAQKIIAQLEKEAENNGTGNLSPNDTSTGQNGSSGGTTSPKTEDQSSSALIYFLALSAFGIVLCKGKRRQTTEK